MSKAWILVLIAGVAFAVLACGDDEGTGNGDPGPLVSQTPDNTAEQPNGDIDGATDESPGQTDEPAFYGEAGATLSIGDDSWSFNILSCSFSPEEIELDRISFTLGSFLSDEGDRMQLDVTIEDTNEEGRYEGDGVVHSIVLTDLENLDDPSFGWSAVSGLAGELDPFIQVDGKSVMAETVFDDELTDAFEEVPGTLDATCP